MFCVSTFTLNSDLSPLRHILTSKLAHLSTESFEIIPIFPHFPSNWSLSTKSKWGMYIHEYINNLNETKVNIFALNKLMLHL